MIVRYIVKVENYGVDGSPAYYWEAGYRYGWTLKRNEANEMDIDHATRLFCEASKYREMYEKHGQKLVMELV